MDKQQLISALNAIRSSEDWDPEEWHYEADALLLQYIDDAEVSEAFEAIERWYA